jgi:hypothetical protein
MAHDRMYGDNQLPTYPDEHGGTTTGSASGAFTSGDQRDPMPSREPSLRDLISFIRVRIRQGGFTIRGGVATCPAELMMNIEAILDAAEGKP